MANKDLLDQLDLPIRQKSLAMLACVAQEIKVDMERRISELGISLLQVNLLHVLDKAPNGQLTVNQLKDNMLDETSNVSRTLNKMCDSGLVKKTRSENDQRVVYITITPQGSKLHKQADKLLLQYENPLNEKESKTLYKLLRKF
ncbi:MarR family winged helix-turn-helix transcriptional regulator [Pseudoteredinibacter isoporae]|uniref:DNA-binding MarR family transcriptional regulator n=1 Tax=Pseudoteredinibacter isoporae TaxID=570281 RepID=A0A7X0JUP8_9GAMM|nr:MarR family transcriptional regulator [Pseudoteredinibacter isoporae]MBB6522179.1 DNA-binding MarR family transcriptional regulator [Pseudoteredinibacter isoporae]NHO87713.1 MarR family transcriptional regulator [Pseudoteredinibacter isoporae]NIB23956.1 MarR family transcriptional regulator [Pseudoteredinibacter isoporae]